MEADSLIEVILWLKTFKIRMENHFTELGETIFFIAPSLSIYFTKSLHKINRESLLFKNLSGRAPVGFNKESALIALPNTPSVSLSLMISR